MVYRDQSGKSKDLVLHRFDLSAEYPEEQSKTDQQQKRKDVYTLTRICARVLLEIRFTVTSGCIKKTEQI